MSKRKLEATRANQERKQVRGGRRLPPGAKIRTRRQPPWLWLGAAGAVVLVAAVVVFLVTRGGGDSGKNAAPKAIPWSQFRGLQTGPAPWTPGINLLSQRIQVLNLDSPQGMTEGQSQHTHQHVDLWIDGKKVTVPASVGINEAQQYLTDLHTHDATGIIHVESRDKNRKFVLGQFFGVWGVKLTPTCIGRYCAGGGKELRVWVDGKRLTTNPALVPLEEHTEVAIAYGTPAQMPKKVPSSYAFPAGV